MADRREAARPVGAAVAIAAARARALGAMILLGLAARPVDRAAGGLGHGSAGEARRCRNSGPPASRARREQVACLGGVIGPDTVRVEPPATGRRTLRFAHRISPGCRSPPAHHPSGSAWCTRTCAPPMTTPRRSRFSPGDRAVMSEWTSAGAARALSASCTARRTCIAKCIRHAVCLTSRRGQQPNDLALSQPADLAHRRPDHRLVRGFWPCWACCCCRSETLRQFNHMIELRRKRISSLEAHCRRSCGASC